MADFSVFVGVVLSLAGIYLLAGLPATLLVAGLFLIGAGVLAAINEEGQNEPDKQITDTDST